MFVFLTKCPLKGKGQNKEVVAEDLKIHPQTLQLILELFTKIEKREELSGEENIVKLAKQLDNALVEGNIETVSFHETLNDILLKISETSSLCRRIEFGEVLHCEVNQWLVYQLVNCGLLTPKTLHTTSVFSKELCEMKTVFIGATK